MKKLLLVVVFILVSVLAFGIDKAYFIDEWGCISINYIVYFQFYDNTVIIYELNVEEQFFEVLHWKKGEDYE